MKDQNIGKFVALRRSNTKKLSKDNIRALEKQYKRLHRKTPGLSWFGFLCKCFDGAMEAEKFEMARNIARRAGADEYFDGQSGLRELLSRRMQEAIGTRNLDAIVEIIIWTHRDGAIDILRRASDNWAEFLADQFCRAIDGNSSQQFNKTERIFYLLGLDKISKEYKSFDLVDLSCDKLRRAIASGNFARIKKILAFFPFAENLQMVINKTTSSDDWTNFFATFLAGFIGSGDFERTIEVFEIMAVFNNDDREEILSRLPYNFVIMFVDQLFYFLSWSGPGEVERIFALLPWSIQGAVMSIRGQCRF